MQVSHVGMEETVQPCKTTTHVRVQTDSLEKTVNKVCGNFSFSC